MSERGKATPSWPEARVEVEPERDETSLETPLEDAAEQAQEALRGPTETVRARAVPLDADPADLADQAREIEDGEDEYR